MNQRAKLSVTRNMPIPGGLQSISPKMMAMFILLAVMGILWGRVLLQGRKGPEKANAQESMELQQMLAESQSAESLEIERVILPQIEGRHDTLSHGMFQTENWEAFNVNSSDGGDVQIDGSNNSIGVAHQQRLERLAQKLVLEAVVQDSQGRPYQAFIDGKILSVGSTLTVKEGPDQYVLTLDEISEKEVTFLWKEISVVLKMGETFEL